MATYERLSAMDRTFLDLEHPENQMQVGGVLTFEANPLRSAAGGISIDRIRRYIASKLHLVPRFRQRIARIPFYDHPVWVDDQNFDLNYHVRHTALPRPGSEEQLKQLAGRILTQELDRRKPLWELWIVEGLDGDRFALISKTHHCMFDGIAGVDLASVLLTTSPEVPLCEPQRWRAQPAPSGVALMLEEAARRFSIPLALGRAALGAISDPLGAVREVAEQALAAGEALTATLWPASDSLFNQRGGAQRRFDWTVFDFGEVKQVKNLLGGKVNDVVLATVAGAVGSFLAARGMTPRQIAGLDFRALVPVNLRSAAQRGTLGNRLALWAARLPIAEKDPIRRVESVCAVTEGLKDSRQAMGADVIARFSEATGPELLSMVVRLAARARSSNLTVTNIPGPPNALYMCGARMLAVYPSAPLLESHALNIALVSYDGRLHWGFNADHDVLPDLSELVAAVRSSFAATRARAHRRGERWSPAVYSEPQAIAAHG